MGNYKVVDKKVFSLHSLRLSIYTDYFSSIFQNISVRLEEVEANAIVGGKRVISKLEARIKDMELELDEEKRRHAETIKILRKKERQLKEVMIQCEEDQKNIVLLQDSLEKTTQKVNIYKRQLSEQVRSYFQKISKS